MKKYSILFSVAVLVLSLAFLSQRVDANPSQFLESSTTATTTVTYLSTGRATTTEAFDTQSDGTYPADSAVLFLQMVASSSSSVLDINIQYSHNNIDWFQDQLSELSTTSPTFSYNPAQKYRYQFSSSTQDLIAVTNANSATTSQTFIVNTPTRYVRAVFSLPPGSTGAGIWKKFVAKKQVR